MSGEGCVKVVKNKLQTVNGIKSVDVNLSNQAIAAATAASGHRKDEEMMKTDLAVASAATLVVAQCVEAAEATGAERDHLASVVSSAVNVRSPGDIMTLTAAAATGDLHWKIVSVYINKMDQVILKMKSKHVVGIFGSSPIKTMAEALE